MPLSFHLMRPDPHTAAQFLSSITPRRVTSENPSYPSMGNQFHLRTLLQDPGDTSLVFYRSKVQVEYSSFPPGRSIRTPFFRISFCSFAKVLRAFFLPGFDHCRIFAEHPSPEHGASISTLSKNPLNRSARFCGTSLVTKALDMPNTSRFFNSALALELLISFATSTPFP